MAEQPWFKFYAADFLLDPKVDALPREGEALLVRMWCICHREGCCPVDVETLARKTQCSQQYVAQFKPQCEPFFELRDGKLYSRRMEEEKQRSEQARENANKRYKKQTAVQTAVRRSDSDSDSDSGFKAPPPVKESVFALEENARAREANETPNNRYSQKDFDARDLRAFHKAREKLEMKLKNGWGRDLTDDQIFEIQCEVAGLPVWRALEVIGRGKEWPATETLGASA